MWHRHIEWIDPIEAASRLADLPGLSLLDSAMAQDDLGRYSTLAADPFGLFQVHGGLAHWNGVAEPSLPLEALRARLDSCACATIPGLPPFQGGAIGCFAYEFGWWLEGRIPPARPRGDDVYLAFHDVVLTFDHAAKTCWLVASGLPAEGMEARRARAEGRLDAFAARLARPNSSCQGTMPPIVWRPTISRDAYRSHVRRVKAYIAAGDIYQANIAQRFVATLSAGADPWTVYRKVRETNPAPFCAYLDQGARHLLSTSPELFLRVRGKYVETRPIKGTARRAPDAAADHAAAEALLASRKDRAENVMIVDLMRNDFSRVCVPDSVRVLKLCGLETYAGLHHLVSVVTGDLRDEADAIDLVAASFPGGSITGAPKLRAMEIIAEIEGVSRGSYCGAIGSIGFDGAVDLNIAIRTLVVEDGAMELRVGGGITILSDPDTEYEETLTKAHRIFDAFIDDPVTDSTPRAVAEAVA